jgi:leucyl aminopeptidase
VEVTATTQSPLHTSADTVAVGLFEGEEASAGGRALPATALQAQLDRGEARATLGRVSVLHHDERRLLLVGLGARGALDGERVRKAAARAHARARELGAGVLAWEAPAGAADWFAPAVVEATVLADYRFTRYRPAPAGERPLEGLVVSAAEDLSHGVARAALLATAQNRARDLANAPPNELTPSALADYAVSLAAPRPGLEVAVHDRQAIRELRMGAVCAVAQGSNEEPRLIELRYEPDGRDEPWLALVGKAVTFDSGGLSLKPPRSMVEMKFDMCGGAAVLEAIAALADLGSPARVLGLVGAVENLPGPGAMRPGDIVAARDGTTIQIDNPDAEGRMVLADCITYARDQGARAIVDIATLTGAVESALGFVYAGLMANDDALAEQVLTSGERVGEPAWRLPLHPRFAEMTKGSYAVLTNRPEPRVGLGSAAAEFLHHFAGEVPWAHLDIAGVADNARLPYLDKGGSGWGVRLLADLAQELAP